MWNSQSYLVGPTDAGLRLDVYVTGQVAHFSRNYVLKLINDGLVMVNSNQVKAKYRLKENDLVAVTIPPAVDIKPQPQQIPLDIYYEDQDLMVINKPKGMVVHPAHGHDTGTLVNALLYHGRHWSDVNGDQRPGIVHRLDKDTTGLLMVAKNNFTHQGLAEQLQQRTVIRGYWALVHGHVKHERGLIDAPIGRDPRDRQRMAVVQDNSKPAVTRYEMLGQAQNYTLLKLRLETGRTHQIRVHLAYIGHPVVGDSRYGPAKAHFNLTGQFLHAYLLAFTHPRTQVDLAFKAGLPKELLVILQSIGLADLVLI